MKVKETIAFTGKADDICTDLIRKLALGNHPLILVTKDNNHFASLSQEILNRIPQADIETIDCVKEGCWEADIIIIANVTNPDSELLEKMKDVATQKILVYIGSKNNPSPLEELKISRQLLPNTEVVQVLSDPVSGEMHIAGADDPVAVIATILIQAGYKTRLLKTVFK